MCGSACEFVWKTCDRTQPDIQFNSINTPCRNDGIGRRAGLKIYFAASYHLGGNP